MNEKMKKPPLGLMPKKIWLLDRNTQIQEAIIRFFESGEPIPVSWIEEYNNIVEEIKKCTL